MAAREWDNLYGRALDLSRKADYVQIVRCVQYATVGGFVGIAIGIGLHVVVPEGMIGIIVGGIIGWKDAATRAYLLRAEAARLLDQCSVEERDSLRGRSNISYFGAKPHQPRRSS